MLLNTGANRVGGFWGVFRIDEADSSGHIPLVLAAIMRLRQPGRRMGDFEHEAASVCAHSTLCTLGPGPQHGGSNLVAICLLAPV